MKYRDPTFLVTRITQQWRERSDELLAQLIAANSIELKKQIIAENSTHWSGVKTILANFSNDKCWYSERKLTETEMEVDHFRPKGAVAGIDHPGYWWLAFDYRNFRLSSATVNKRRKNTLNSIDDDVFGKGTSFPLLDEANRALDSTAVIDGLTFQVGNERPVLIDPLVADDPVLLDFNFQEGLVAPAIDLVDGDIDSDRANTSIEIYNLNSAVLLPMRLHIARTLNNLLGEVKVMVQKRREDPQSVSATEIREKFKTIVTFVCDEAEFCTFSKRYLQHRRHEFPEFIDKIIAAT